VAARELVEIAHRARLGVAGCKRHLREVHRRGRGAARLKVGPLTGNKTAVYGLTVSTPGRLERSPQPGDSGLFPQRGWAAPRQPPRGRWVRSDDGFVRNI